jgi:hypothetical protein
MQIKLKLDIDNYNAVNWIYQNGTRDEDYGLVYCCSGRECDCQGNPDIHPTADGWAMLESHIKKIDNFEDLSSFLLDLEIDVEILK